LTVPCGTLPRLEGQAATRAALAATPPALTHPAAMLRSRAAPDASRKEAEHRRRKCRTPMPPDDRLELEVKPGGQNSPS